MTIIESEPIILEAPIQEVLLFKNGSKMIRTGSVKVPEGDSQVALKFLPDSMDSSSVKVTGKGKMVGRIRSMNIERQYEQGASMEDIERQEKELEGMREHEALLVRKSDFYQVRKADLVKLRESFLNQFPFVLPEDKPVKFLLQSGAGDTSILSPRTAIDEFLGNIDGLIGTIVEKLVALNDDLVDLREKIDVLVRQLDQQRYKTDVKAFKKVILDITSQGEGDFTFTVEYVIHAGYWESIYDVLINDESDKVTIKLLASVTNDTSEDWNDIVLTISNANLQPVQVIEPIPWRLREYVPYSSTRKDYGAFDEKKVMAAYGPPPPPQAAPAIVNAMIPKEREMQEMAKQSTEIGGSATGGVITFTLSSKVTIKEGSFKNNIYLTEIELAGKTEFFWNAENAKLIVQNAIQNGDMQFLPGAAKIYVSDDYIGETSMNVVLPNEEFILGTREANDLKVEKKLVKRTTDKGGLAKGKVIKNYSYVINVEILSDEARKNDLILVDKIPYSDSELVKVQVTGDIEPQPEEIKLGVIKWRINLTDQDKKFKIVYNYQVSYNSDVIIDTSLP